MPTKSWKNHPKKLHTYGSWDFFFSAALTAQNSPELHFRFIFFFIQPSLLESLEGRDILVSLILVLKIPLFFVHFFRVSSFVLTHFKHSSWCLWNEAQFSDCHSKRNSTRIHLIFAFSENIRIFKADSRVNILQGLLKVFNLNKDLKKNLRLSI